MMYILCMDKINLTTETKQFFSLVSQAAFANPFSERRVELDRQIGGVTGSKQRSEIVAAMVREVGKRIEKLEKEGAVKITDFETTDQELIRHLYLFDVYHKFAKDFDNLIIEQTNAGDEPIEVLFAKDALSLLTKRGFSGALAKRYFSLYYQIRRGFHFIDRGLVGQSKSMRELRMNLWNNIFTHDISYYERYMWDKMEDFSTLLLGPTGCGKGAAAAAIGRSGFISFDEKRQRFAESFTNTFIPINLSQHPQTLLESELFGHTKGAFTGAIAPHEGLFSLCGPYGSIFLDEIGELSEHVQVKLLAVLEERCFRQVGSHKKLKFNGRVIAATNRTLDELRNKGNFRDDFYYRLCSDCIKVPSLHQRIQENPDELKELIAVTVERITGEKSGEIIKTVLEVISKDLAGDYHWPGNVRELAQCVRRVIIKREYQGDINGVELNQLEHLHKDIDSLSLDGQTLLSRYCRVLYEQHKNYEEVGRITGLDRRTVKKYLELGSA